MINTIMNIADSDRNKIEVYLIGGGALMARSLKVQTKDIDLIVRTKFEYDVFESCLIDSGYVADKPGNGYEHFSISQVFIKGDVQIDLFLEKVCGKFMLSDKMAKRSEVIGVTNNIVLKVCALEDILLFKSMTDREGDLEDSQNILMQKILNWDTILDEIDIQIENGEEVWITWITERMELLSDRGLRIPILNRLVDLSNMYLEKRFGI